MPSTSSTSRGSRPAVNPIDRPDVSTPSTQPATPLSAPQTARVVISDGPSASATTGVSSVLAVRIDQTSAVDKLREARESLEAGGDLDAQLANGLGLLYSSGGEAVKAEIDKLIQAMVQRMCTEKRDYMDTAASRAIPSKNGQQLLQLGNQLVGHPFPGTMGGFTKLYEKRLNQNPSADIKAAEAQVRLTERKGAELIELGWEVTGQVLTSFDHDTRVDAMSFVDADGAETRTESSMFEIGHLEELTAMIKTALSEGDGAFADRLITFVVGAVPTDLGSYDMAKAMEGDTDLQASLLPAGRTYAEHLGAIEDKFAEKFPLGPKLSELSPKIADIRSLRKDALPLKSMQKIGLLETTAASDFRSAIYNLTKNPDLQGGPADSPVRRATEDAITRVVDQELPKMVGSAQTASAKIVSEGLLHVDAETVSVAMERFKDLAWLAEELGGRRDDVKTELSALTNKLVAAVQLLAADLSPPDPATDDLSILRSLNHAQTIETWIPEATKAFEDAQTGATKFFVQQQRSFKDHPQRRDFSRLLSQMARIDEPLATQARALREL